MKVRFFILILAVLSVATLIISCISDRETEKVIKEADEFIAEIESEKQTETRSNTYEISEITSETTTDDNFIIETATTAETSDFERYSEVSEDMPYNPFEPDENGWVYIHGAHQLNSTYMGVQCITNEESDQYIWLTSHDWDYNDEGIVTYDGRLLVALTPTYGNVGDYVDLLLADETILPVIIGDVKYPADTYGYWIGDRLNVLELIVAPWWYDVDHENIYYPDVVAFRNIMNE